MCLILFSPGVFAQDTAAVKKLIQTVDDYRAKLPYEKLYLQLDRPYYATGDTIWFKAFLFNSGTFSPSPQSSKLYVELINDSSRVVNRFAVPLNYGLGQGHIILNDLGTDGSYTLRAYTNWMQNFGEAVFFNKQFYVGKPSNQGSWLVNEQHVIKQGPDVNTISLNLQLTDLDKMTVPYRDVELRLTEGKSTLFKGNYSTSDEGKIATGFPLSSKNDTRKLSLIITDKTTKKILKFPFYPGGPLQNIDLQFMPEGGYLVNGMPSRVAFKAIGEDGFGIDVKGVIVDGKGEEVSAFQSLHKGVGSFILLPQANQFYTAKFMLGGLMRTVPLPAARAGGIALKVDNTSSPDSVFVYIRATENVAKANKTYNLVAQSTDAVYLAMALNLSRGFRNLRYPKNMFLSGITSFIILDNTNAPICQRKVFIDHHDRLRLDINTSNAKYSPQDSVAVNLNVRDIQGKPVQGSFAVAVTDDSYSAINPYNENISSRLLFTSELSGYIEEPGWYLTATDKEKTRALDNLMLAQGWTGFDWTKIIQPGVQPKFRAEPDNSLSGSLRNIWGKAAKNQKLNLFSLNKKHGLIVLDTVSDEAGNFAFNNLPIVDSIKYTLHVKDKKGDDSRANIMLNEFKPASVNTLGDIRIMPWYVHTTDSLMINTFNRPQPLHVAGIDPRDVKGKLLKEVKIRGIKPAVQFGNVYGFVEKEVQEKDLVEMGKTSIFDILHKKINNLYIGFIYRANNFSKPQTHDTANFVIGFDLLSDVFVDGQSAQAAYGYDATGDPIGFREYVRGLFYYLGADDIKNIKLASGINIFLSITTRSGQGLYTRSSPGIITYRPIPVCMPRQFYRPRYCVANKPVNDARPTIHWEPNLITDSTGKATLSFFAAAAKPGTYTVVVEGADMAGNFGSQTSKIIISPAGTINPPPPVGR